MDYREIEMTDLTLKEIAEIEGKKFMDMLLEYDSEEEEKEAALLCKKWASESETIIEMDRKIYNYAKRFWNEEELKEKIKTDCFTDKEFCEKIFK